jgi:DNA helicase HerA-like ATPase
VTTAANPLFGEAEAPLNPAELFAGGSARTRVSVVNLSGLSSEAARDFVNRLQMALFCWIRRHPGPTERLYVLDEAQDFLPARETPPCKRSALALAAQGAERGLGIVLATGEPGALDPTAITGSLTQIYGGMSSPAEMERVKAMMATRGGAREDLARLKPSEFYYVTEGLSRPIKIRTPLCLSRRAQNPPTPNELAAIARRQA